MTTTKNKNVSWNCNANFSTPANYVHTHARTHTHIYIYMYKIRQQTKSESNLKRFVTPLTRNFKLSLEWIHFPDMFLIILHYWYPRIAHTNLTKGTFYFPISYRVRQHNSCINWINLCCFNFTTCFGHLDHHQVYLFTFTLNFSCFFSLHWPMFIFGGGGVICVVYSSYASLKYMAKINFIKIKLKYIIKLSRLFIITIKNSLLKFLDVLVTHRWSVLCESIILYVNIFIYY
jgi:hypothetical protein